MPTELLLTRKESYLSSRSSSPKVSKYTEPQRQARLSRITIMYDEVTTRKIPVPPPQSIEC